MRSVSGKQFCKLLEARGWQLKRIHGSHFIYAKTGVAVRISVPVHGDTSLRRGLQRHLMKLAGFDESDL